MGFLTVKEESVAKEAGSSYATTSGCYDVNLKAVEVVGTTNGATQLNYLMDKANSYGNTAIDKQGKQIFGFRIVEALAAILGEDGLSDPEPTEVKFKNSTKELMCLPELTDVDVKVWIQFTYKLWNGEIQERVAVKRFYRISDGASGSEALSKKGIGTQIAKDTKYFDEVKYEDGLDAAKIEAWKAEQAKARGGNSTTEATSSKGSAAAFPGDD